jgi:uroporphyrinogen decarboxylase
MTSPSINSGAGEAAARPSSNDRARFCAAARCEPVDRPPVWLMRQAGRCLPEYRALKEEHSFLELVRTPDLAAEATLQPIRRFGFDAAVLFSDILVVPEAMGQPYHFREQGGIDMAFAIRTEDDLCRLNVEGFTGRLGYVAEAITRVKAALDGRTALLGFAGSPWTLAHYMIEGGSRGEGTAPKALFYSRPDLFNKLMETLTRSVAAFLNQQIAAGVDAVQIFDSSGGDLADNAYEPASAKWIREIIAGIAGKVPVILFARGTHGQWPLLAATGANILSLDWTQSIGKIRDALPGKVGVQGNLDPALLATEPGVVARETERILKAMAGKTGHIFNLGHGVPPSAKLECIEALVETVRGFRP